MTKYAAVVRAWEEEEFNAYVKAYHSGNPALSDLAVDDFLRKKTIELVFDAENEEEARRIAEVKAVEAGAPPISAWAPYSMVEVWPLPYRTLREVLKAPRSSFAYDVWHEWVEFLNVEDLQSYSYIDRDEITRSKRVRTDYLVDYCFDGRRTWTFGIVSFDDEPVLVYQRAGREGDDFKRSFLVSKAQKTKLVAFLRSMLTSEEEEADLDNVDVTLCRFYGNELAHMLMLEQERNKGRNKDRTLYTEYTKGNAR